MLIRVRGYTAGIKEYLEKGQKKGRDMERDEMDERVVLAGDLQIVNDIIESIDTDAERYLSITMSFKEDDIDRKLLEQIVAEFEQFAFAAYQPGEYVMYAEAHLARIKSYANRKTGEQIERKPHIHIVIPKYNLLSGKRLDPFELVDNQSRYIDAFQEHVNNKYGLASPKNNRRVEFTDASEMISRYKGDVFEGANTEAKAQILAAVVERGVTDYDQFKGLLAEFGETKPRNAGRESEYQNVKLPGAARGINLKDHVFSREFIELPTSEKQDFITAEYMPRYEETGEPRPTPDHMLASLQHWQDVASKEVKYLNGAFRATYRASTPEERQTILATRERNFYQRYDNEDFNEQPQERNTAERMGRGDSGPRRSDPHAGGPGARQRRTPGRSAGFGADAAEKTQDNDREQNTERDADRDRPWPPAESNYRVRSLSRIGMDGGDPRREVLLSPASFLQLGEHGPASADPVRRGGDLSRGDPGRGLGLDWRYILAAEYEAYAKATNAERAAMRSPAVSGSTGRAGARNRVPFPGSLEDAGQAKMLSRMPSLSNTPLLHTGKPAARQARPGRARGAGLRLDAATGRCDIRSGRPGFGPAMEALGPPRNLQDLGAEPPARPQLRSRSPRRNPRPRNTATGREADNVLSQLARDREEAAKQRAGGHRTEFQEIRQELDAERLLKALSHSHGVLPGKYEITIGRDGADRIKVGSRSLNVTDFLTKELHLSWADASKFLRTTYQEQVDSDPAHQVRQAPQQDLWREFQETRASQLEDLRAKWLAQGDSERSRRAASREEFIKERTAIVDNGGIAPADRRARLSLARMDRVEREAAIRDAILAERTELKRQGQVPLDEHYREFLRGKAEAGDERALKELRRLRRRQAPEPARTSPAIQPQRNHEQRSGEANAIIYHGYAVTHEVRANGQCDRVAHGAERDVSVG